MSGTGVMAFIDNPELQTIKEHPPDSIINLEKTDAFPGERCRDVDVLASPTEATPIHHTSNFEVAGVLNFPKDGGEGGEGRTVQVSRPAEPDSLMRPHFVVLG